MKIFLGADHGGFYLKEKIEAYLTKRDIEWEDVGDKILDPQDDFPQFAQMAVTKIKSLNQCDKLICHLFQKSFISFAKNGLLKFIGVSIPNTLLTPTAIKLYPAKSKNK